ncbi:MAG TPA: virion core protein (lumpy skin disease virus), partial [Clostridiales bacterium]|nr:virion core protein (lumpy skin disease virus) [Clostridiales bacterium]
GGTFADQWKDFISPPPQMTDHVLLAAGMQQQQNAGRGSNTKGSTNIISNGSLILVPEGVGLLLVSEGKITGLVTEPGGYEFQSDNLQSSSVFAGNGFWNSLVKQSWERFKFGGMPGASQLALYVNLKEIAGLRYGTSNPIRYKDANYGGAMLAVTSFGNFSIKVVDPIALYKNLIPVNAAMGGETVTLDDNGSAASQSVFDTLFSGFVGALSTTLSAFTKGGKSIDTIQEGAIDFALLLDEVVEEKFQWKTNYGLEVVAVQPRGLDWDAPSTELVNKYTTGMMMQGNVGNAYAQTAVADGIKAAGENPTGGGGAAIGMMGMGAGMVGGIMQQPVAPGAPAAPADDPLASLQKLKGLLDSGVITQQDYDQKKAEILSRL